MIWHVVVTAGTQSQWVGGGIVVAVALTLVWTLASRSTQVAAELPRHLVTLGAAWCLALFGARLGAAVHGDLAWAAFFNPQVPGFATTGAAILLAVGALFLWRSGWYSRLNHVAVSLFVGLAFSRIGCVYNGCDFGRVASSGMAYARPAPAWQAHVLTGLDPSQLYSWPTFPFPVLDALNAVGAAGLVWGLGWRGAEPSPRAQALARNATPLAALGYFALRFVLEFGRSPATSVAFGPFNRPQWFCLGFVVILTVFLAIQGRDRESVSSPDA